MIEHWRRVGISVQLADDDPGSSADNWDLVYRADRLIEPLIDLWPLLTQHADTRVEALKPLPERVRRQLLELERVNDWASANFVAPSNRSGNCWWNLAIFLFGEVDEFFVIRRHLTGLPLTFNAYLSGRGTMDDAVPGIHRKILDVVANSLLSSRIHHLRNRDDACEHGLRSRKPPD